MNEKSKQETIEGYYEFEDYGGLIYTSEESWKNGNPYQSDVYRVLDLLEKYHNKKIKIIIEEID